MFKICFLNYLHWFIISFFHLVFAFLFFSQCPLRILHIYQAVPPNESLGGWHHQYCSFLTASSSLSDSFVSIFMDRLDNSWSFTLFLLIHAINSFFSKKIILPRGLKWGISPVQVS